MDLIYAIDLAGTFVFALSGVATATEKKFDLFGAGSIALVTAVGGGTVRDVLMDTGPVAWLSDLNYLIVVGLALLASIFVLKTVLQLRRTLFLFDALGIGLFTVLGLNKALAAGLSETPAVLMGVISASFGGVLRDVLCNEVPLIFRKEIYATACMAGAVLYLLLRKTGVGFELSAGCTMAFIVIIRVAAVRRGWALPLVTLTRRT